MFKDVKEFDKKKRMLRRKESLLSIKTKKKMYHRVDTQTKQNLTHGDMEQFISLLKSRARCDNNT